MQRRHARERSRRELLRQRLAVAAGMGVAPARAALRERPLSASNPSGSDEPIAPPPFALPLVVRFTP